MHVVAGLFPSSWTGNVPFKLPFAANLIVYLAIVAVCLTVLAQVFRYNRRQSKATSTWRWTTQDIIVIAILGVLLEVYDNLIGDQFITPLVQGIPLAHAFAINDLPYMFLLMTGVAIVRKPGSATALVFLNFLLMQLLYGGSESSPLYWAYGLLQGVFVDLYLLSRRGRAFSRPGWPAVRDGLAMGALRAVPAVTLQTAIIQPLLSGATQTGAYILLYSTCNLIGNGLEAGITAPLALRVARTVNPSAGYDEELDEEDSAELSAGTGSVPATSEGGAQ
jgi:ABC-type cobalt transport system permease component